MEQPNKGTILIVDDNDDDRMLLARPLRKAGYHVELSPTGAAALELYAEQRFDLCIVDQAMPEMDGLSLLAALRECDPTAQIIIFTGYGSIDRAVEAMRRGAVDFLTKPVEPEVLLTRIDKALAMDAVLAENRSLRAEVTKKFDFPNLVAEAPETRNVLALAAQAADHDVTVLITGESGVGKEVVARAIHYNSTRRSGSFFAFNCAAISESLVESELFGHERGAFTGADRRKEGLIEQAAKGTLLLDEIGELPLAAQAKLLRVIDTREMIRVGGTRAVRVPARLIAATNRNLPQEVGKGHFREDLYFRLNVFAIHIPPLRERRADIMPLAEHFLKRLGQETGKEVKGFSDDAVRHLGAAAWPGNVRELANTVERAVIVNRSGLITAKDFPPPPDFAPNPVLPATQSGQPANVDDVQRAAGAMERDLLLNTLERAGNNISEAARILGMGRGALRHRMAKYDINPGGRDPSGSL